MIKTIFSLEIVFAHYVVMRYVAAVASSCLPVRAVHPAVVFGGHHMAIHAGLGVITHIRNYFRFFGDKQRQAHYAAKDDYGIGQPTRRVWKKIK